MSCENLPTVFFLFCVKAKEKRKKAKENKKKVLKSKLFQTAGTNSGKRTPQPIKTNGNFKFTFCIDQFANETGKLATDNANGGTGRKIGCREFYFFIGSIDHLTEAFNLILSGMGAGEACSRTKAMAP